MLIAFSFTLYSLALALLPTTSLGRPSSASISSQFTDKKHRIERSFAPPDEAKKLLLQIVHEGFETEPTKLESRTVVVKGYQGDPNVEQLEKEQFASALKAFITNDNHGNQPTDDHTSLVYYIERLQKPTLEVNENLIQKVVDNNVLADGGTIHLYLSSPKASALANHTDTTDIVVVQLEGKKEWLLCKEKESTQITSDFASLLRAKQTGNYFSEKLNSCSTYRAFEMDQLDCETTVLYPGDALFLPRRTVHSARASSDSFSAHLTFGFNEYTMCKDYPVLPDEFDEEHRMLDQYNCDGCTKSCDNGCDETCNYGCDGCDLCLAGCDSRSWTGGTSCDECCISCDHSCDEDCNSGCDDDCNRTG